MSRDASATARRTLALCADDFGLNAAVNQGVLQLLANERLTEVSCLVNGPAWADGAAALAQQRVRAGLHFNLTEGRPLSAALRAVWPRQPALPALIAKAHLGLLPMPALRDEWAAQWAAFEQGIGRPPDHVDGHQHVHHLPGVRALVLAACAARPGLRVRDTGRVAGPGFAFKRGLIEGTGGRALHRALSATGQAANSALFGVHDFQRRDYRGLMQQWLAALPARGALLFCHPGTAAVAGAAADPIAAARVRELAYLDSAAFTDDLRSADVALGAAA